MGKEKDDKNKIEIVSAGAEPGTGGGPVKREESREQQRNEQYNQYVEQVTPKANCLLNCVKAFITGGCICTVGQILTVLFLNSGMGKDEAAAYTTISLVFASVVLTGLNIYPLITTWGGAGSLVPITGFANSVVAPAIEYKKKDRYSVSAQNFYYQWSCDFVRYFKFLDTGRDLPDCCQPACCVTV